MLGDPFDDMPQISPWIEALQFGRADEAVDCRGSLTAGIRTGEEIVFSPEGKGALIVHLIVKCLKTLKSDFLESPDTDDL